MSFGTIAKAARSQADFKSAFSNGAHNTMLQHAAMSYASSSAWGAGIGAAYGGLDGALSYDGSFFGGAIHGGMVGAAAGLGARGISGMYQKGSGLAAGTADTRGRFAWANIGKGWNAG